MEDCELVVQRLSLSLSRSPTVADWWTARDTVSICSHTARNEKKPNQLQVAKQPAKTESQRIQRAEKEYTLYTVKINWSHGAVNLEVNVP